MYQLNGYGKQLGSEVWLAKIIELFGKDVPIVLFAPIGFRLNLTAQSKRWVKLTNGTYPAITSIISLPKNVFPNVVFHSEILIFNVQGLEPHYFYQKFLKKECFGCGDKFACSPSANYDYCANCELNGSRYLQNKCPECGDGSGVIKFKGQPPRACKTCALTKKNHA